MPKYDNGERWDLKAKCVACRSDAACSASHADALRHSVLLGRYTDEGYEDADSDVMGKFMALFKSKRDKDEK